MSLELYKAGLIDYFHCAGSLESVCQLNGLVESIVEEVGLGK